MRSEIRDSTIRDLIRKVQKDNFSKYLKAIRLEKIRFFNGASIQFNFPVTALIGPNGSGKSTILNSAACCYSSINPPNIFKKSRIGDESMNDWQIDYELIDKTINQQGTIRTSLRFNNNVWNRDSACLRDVKLFSINRTVPASENPLFLYKKKLSMYSSKKEIEILSNEINGIENIKKESEKVLGRSLEDFKLLELTFKEIRKKNRKYKTIIENIQNLENEVKVITQRRVAIDPNELKPFTKILQHKQLVYIGHCPNGEYSEFNFGSGEAAVIRMVADIESLEEGSLILIEEIENGLHPLAVCRMVEYLIDVAQRKRIQSIFTTHSDYALAPLPSEAIWASIDGRLQQGKLSIEILRAVSGRVDRQLAIFVEDDFAKVWLEAIIRETLGDRIHEIGIYPVQGDGNAVKTHRYHRSNPAVESTSLCFIDGDSLQEVDEAFGIYRLPQGNPESSVFNAVLNNLETNIALLTVACQRPLSKQDEIKKIITDVSYTNRDPHLLFSQIGLKLSFMPEAIIKGAFISIWMAENKDFCDKMANIITLTLNKQLEE